MFVFWRMMCRDPIVAETPRLLFPTLLVRSVMALLTEFTPRTEEKREKDAGANDGAPD